MPTAGSLPNNAAASDWTAASLHALAMPLDESLREALRAARFVVWSLDRNRVFTHCEGDSTALLGIAPGEVIGRSVYDLFGHLEPFMAGVERAFRDEVSVASIQLGDLTLDLWQRRMYDDRAQDQGLLGVASDVLRRLSVPAANNSWQERFCSLVDHAPDIIVAASPDGRIEFINRTVPGVDMTKAIGTLVFDWVPKEHHELMRQKFERVMKSGRTDDYEVAGYGPYGSMAWYRTRVGPIVRDDRPIGLMLITSDITQRKAVEEQLRAEQRFLRHLLEAHERDRKLTSYELHDGLIQHVTGALMHFEALRYKSPLLGQEPEEYEASLGMLRETIAEGRRLISGLRPPIIDELGIVAAIEFLVREQQTVDLEVTFCHETSFRRLDCLVEANLFRIVQEILNNVSRHSQAKHAQIKLTHNENRIRLEARDDGVGFDPDKVPKHHFGLQGLRERARLLGGRTEIRSQPGQGTEIVVMLPMILSAFDVD